MLVIVLFIGSLDNARPVSTWSDDKLKRMYGKLLNASSAEGNREKSAQHFKKAQEVKQELEKRKLQNAEQFAAGLADQMAPAIQEITQKTLEVVQRIMQEEKVSFDEAHTIMGNGLRGKLTNLLIPLTKGTQKAKEIGRLEKLAEKINATRDDVVHRGEFRDEDKAAEAIAITKQFVEGLVRLYEPDFELPAERTHAHQSR